MELKLDSGSMIAINTIAVENEVADNMYQRSELDYLIYNDPVAYAELIDVYKRQIHTIVTYNLSAQQAVCTLLKDHLHGHHLAAGIVTSMTHGGQNDSINIQTCLAGVGFVDAGGSCGHIEYLNNGASLTAQITAVSAANIVSNDTALLVGGTGQRNQGILAGNVMLHLYGCLLYTSRCV